MVWRDEVAPEEVPLGACGAEWRSGWTADVDEAASTAADGWAEGNDVGVGVFFDFPFPFAGPFPFPITAFPGALTAAAEALKLGARDAAEDEAAAGGCEVATEVDEEEMSDGGVAPGTASGLLHSASCC